jgi:ribosomal protein S18 acetylase RimI-like enzyme
MTPGEDHDMLVEETKRAVKAQGASSLVVTDLTFDDLPHVWWAGNAAHVRGLRATVERAARGEIDYLAVRAPSGLPVTIGGIMYGRHEGAGEPWQLSTHGSLQGLGLGTRLIAEAEKRIAERGLRRAVIGVEDDNPRARALYERLGYREFGCEEASWEVEDENGARQTKITECTLLEKILSEQEA